MGLLDIFLSCAIFKAKNMIGIQIFACHSGLQHTKLSCKSGHAGQNDEMSDKIDWYNTWHFFNEGTADITGIDLQNPMTWASEADFTWAGDIAEVEKSLWTEGVVTLGFVSEKYLGRHRILIIFNFCFFCWTHNPLTLVLTLAFVAAGVRAFCTENKYDAVLSLGAERREDSYAAKGSILGGPWAPWMSRHKYEYGYSSVITGVFHSLLSCPYSKHEFSSISVLSHAIQS